MTLLAQAAMPAFHIQLARRLGVGGYGLYVWSNNLVDLTSLVTLFGMDAVVTNEVSRAKAAGDTERACRSVGSALRVVVLTGLAMALLIAAGAPQLAAVSGKPAAVFPLRALTVVPIAYHAASIFLVATQARMAMRYDFWARGLFQPLSLLALTTALLAWGLPGACVAVAVAMGLTAILAGYFYSRELPLGPTLRAALFHPVDWKAVRAALPLVAMALIWAFQGRLDRFMLGLLRPAAEVGAYGACGIYVVSLGQVRGVFVPGMTAVLPGLLARDDTKAIRLLVQRTQRWVALLAVPLFVLFSVFGEGLLAVFGRGAIAGAHALPLLALGSLFGTLSLPSTLLLFGDTRHRWTLSVSFVASLVAQIAIMPALTERWGIAGPAAAAALGMLIAQGIQQYTVWKIHRVHGFSAGLARVFVAGLLAAIPGRALFLWAPWALAPRFFAGVALAAAIYATVAARIGLEADERRSMIASLARAWAIVRSTVEKRRIHPRSP